MATVEQPEIGTAHLGSLLGQEFQARLDSLLKSGLPIWELVAEIERLYAEGFQPLAEMELTQAILRGWITGARDVLDYPDLPTLPRSGWPPVPPPNIVALLYPSDEGPIVRLPAIENAVKELLQRIVVAPDEFYRLSAAARREAFTVSGDLTTAAIEDIRDLLAEDIREGASLAGFNERLLERMGTLPSSPAHLENVFRSNTLEAYSQGHETILGHPMVRDAFPFRLYSATHDARTRENHRALETLGLDGTAVYWADDPVWLRFRPPWDFQCRCSFIALGVDDAARYGVTAAIRWLETVIQPPHEFVPMPDFAPSPSWDRLAVAV